MKHSKLIAFTLVSLLLTNVITAKKCSDHPNCISEFRDLVDAANAANEKPNSKFRHDKLRARCKAARRCLEIEGCQLKAFGTVSSYCKAIIE
ncbi:unnamed protein product [Caenorhabditis bovis]|uniref:DUF19 domain-containing protein n=1 Tax=Caenorhabditis bovis TaxID=2654633 RepID=A0A8S1EWG9_9PELO|nr:unnamed protein product [Caenorhabditis bovis]